MLSLYPNVWKWGAPPKWLYGENEKWWYSISIGANLQVPHVQTYPGTILPSPQKGPQPICIPSLLHHVAPLYVGQTCETTLPRLTFHAGIRSSTQALSKSSSSIIFSACFRLSRTYRQSPWFPILVPNHWWNLSRIVSPNPMEGIRFHLLANHIAFHHSSSLSNGTYCWAKIKFQSRAKKHEHYIALSHMFFAMRS